MLHPAAFFCYNFCIKPKQQKKKKEIPLSIIAIAIIFLLLVAYVVLELTNPFRVDYQANVTSAVSSAVSTIVQAFVPPPLDKADYDRRMNTLANNPAPKVSTSTTTSTGTSTLSSTTTPPIHYLWPAKAAYPNGGALLPFNRIVAYYGNFYSKNMGVLGQYPEDELISKLASEVAKWEAADPNTPVIPAIQYIAVTAQGSPGVDGMYRARMPKDQIEKAITLAEKVHGVTILDVQDGKSTVQQEIPLLADYLKKSDVHLAIDPEFSMKTGKAPGTVIGTMDATDINYVIEYLAKIVKDNHLPPKMLVIHRFTDAMVTNTQNIETVPEVQVVMDMDGWGAQPQKIATYKNTIYPYPVQFTGFKLFYKNDTLPPSTGMLSPQQILNLRPKPIYIQYQ